jgi:hypothetical protein
VEQQDRGGDGGDHGAGAGPAAKQPQQRARRLQEGSLQALLALAMPGERDGGLHHVDRDPPGVDAAQGEHPADQLLGGAAPLPGEVALAHHGDGVQQELAGHEPVEPGEPRERQGRVDQDGASHGGGGGGRLQQGDQAAYRVANQDRGAADDLVEEAVEQPPVGLDGRGAAGRRREAVTGEVDGEDPMVLGERRTDREPVDVRAAEAVHADQHGRSRRTAEVDEVHRAANLDGPRGRRRARAPTCVHEA